MLLTKSSQQHTQMWKSRISTSVKLKLYNTCILPMLLFGSEYREVTKVDGRMLNDLDQWCVWRLSVSINWY